MRIAVITTSRADYGIYHSLLTCLAQDPEVAYGMVVSGTHLSPNHGFTRSIIEADGHPIWGEVMAIPVTDTPAGIAQVIGQAIQQFAVVWGKLADTVDMIVCLGDRYEMFAAVAATVPFNLPVAHLHGGETTLGAIDDKFRHAITSMSTLHFTATHQYADRVAAILDTRKGVHAVGAPSLDGVEALALPTRKALDQQFGTNFISPTILITLHPETVDLSANTTNLEAIHKALKVLLVDYQVVVTLPNADTQGQIIRKSWQTFAAKHPRVQLLENFGRQGYFAAMKYCTFLLGNTSSGLLEAASLGKYAINVGRRQAGRMRGANVLDVSADAAAILNAVQIIATSGGVYTGPNPYVLSGNAGAEMLALMKEWLANEGRPK